MADLHVQLANSYRGSAALRSEFFDALSNIHIAEGIFHCDTFILNLLFF